MKRKSSKLKSKAAKVMRDYLYTREETQNMHMFVVSMELKNKNICHQKSRFNYWCCWGLLFKKTVMAEVIISRAYRSLFHLLYERYAKNDEVWSKILKVRYIWNDWFELQHKLFTQLINWHHLQKVKHDSNWVVQAHTTVSWSYPSESVYWGKHKLLSVV